MKIFSFHQSSLGPLALMQKKRGGGNSFPLRSKIFLDVGHSGSIFSGKGVPLQYIVSNLFQDNFLEFSTCHIVPLFHFLSELCLVAQSCLTFSYPMDWSPPGSSVHGDPPGKNTGVSCHALLQGIFPIQDRTQVSDIAGGFFTNWATREALL